MCGACEDEVFLTTPNPHCVLRGLGPDEPAARPARSRFAAITVDDEASPRPLPVVVPPLLSLSRGRAVALNGQRA
jgi:hypothetical protein